MTAAPPEATDVHGDTHRIERVAIVTGASRGIGRAVALGLASDGYRVALLARGREDLEAVAAEIRSARGPAGAAPPALVMPGDVADASAVEAVVDEIARHTGRVDLLFNNAGIVRRGSSGLAPRDIADMWATNFLGPFSLVRSVAPIMVRQKSGHVFNVSSRSGIFPKAKNGGYAATKAALRALGAALYQELAPHGIKVTTIFPSYVDTAQSAGQVWLPDERKIRPDDIHTVIRLLTALSPNASVQEIMVECTHVVAHGEHYA